jgi:hypothetical protein
MRRKVLLAGLLIATLCAGGYAVRGQQSGTVDSATRAEVIDLALAQLQKAYVFADAAEKMSAAVRARAAAREYDGITGAREFAEKLTADLQAVSHDKHLRISYSPDGLLRRLEQPGAPSLNFGFEKVERLDGNVGYIDLRGFSGSPDSRAAAVAAMNSVADTDALIFDLRRNGGGSPFMIGILCSYLFDSVVHLNDFYVRETDSRQQFFTSAEVQGRRYGQGKPVFILTSARTFSAAEEFTYDLKNLKRAIVVGETTGGGAHPGGLRPLTGAFGIWLPNGRAINPVTGTNWEGVGVEPDIKLPALEALDAAHREALQKLLASATDPARRERLQSAINGLKKS